ncbi:MAG: transporter substrate-binding domain-containing protein [Oscillospiraceae bacterium]|nr:transporter substrate-binding domain-containing protein [Oscillospiraceae bacterium]
MLFSLAGCGASGYKVNILKVLKEQHYYISFRNDDPLADCVMGAIEVLSSQGVSDSLSSKWFGSGVVKFDKNEKALDNIQIPEERTLIIGVDTNAFPFAYETDVGIWGFDIEFATAVCDYLGWKIQIMPIEPADVYIQLYSGNIDCAWGGVALSDKESESDSFVSYGPYADNDIVIATRNGSTVWNTWKLNNKNMAICKTKEMEDALSEYPSVTKRPYQILRVVGGTTECFDLLYSGVADAIITDSTAVAYYNSH